MSKEWLILIVSALTDALISMGTSLTTAMVTQGSVSMPGKAVLLLSLIGGVVAAARTVQQALKGDVLTGPTSLSGRPTP